MQGQLCCETAVEIQIRCVAPRQFRLGCRIQIPATSADTHRINQAIIQISAFPDWTVCTAAAFISIAADLRQSCSYRLDRFSCIDRCRRNADIFNPPAAFRIADIGIAKIRHSDHATELCTRTRHSIIGRTFVDHTVFAVILDRCDRLQLHFRADPLCICRIDDARQFLTAPR